MLQSSHTALHMSWDRNGPRTAGGSSWHEISTRANAKPSSLFQHRSRMPHWQNWTAPAQRRAAFAEIAARLCSRAVLDLASRGLNEEGRKDLRLFSTWEITRYLIPVAQAHFRRVLKAESRPAPGAHQKQRAAPNGSPFDEVLRLRAFFGAQGSKGQGTTCPIVPPDSPPRWWPWPISRAAWARPQPQRIWPCRRALGRLPGAGDRSGQPGLDDLDLWRSGSRMNGRPPSRCWRAITVNICAPRTSVVSTGAIRPQPLDEALECGDGHDRCRT